MKFVIVSLIQLCVLFSFTTGAQTKHAIIFAIGHYPQEGGWDTISSLNDVGYIKTALLNQDFKPQNIKVITDSNATIKGIISAVNELTSKVKAGDIVVLHFSSHGEQVEDQPQGDETDYLDESIVTYNAKEPSHSKDFEKDQEEYLRDDMLDSVIDQLRLKLGRDGDIVVFMDLCHSGSGTRGIKKVRGDKPPLVSSTFDKRKYGFKDTAGVFKEKATSRGSENELAAYVVFSAARAEELDAEILDDNKQSVGPLTYAISKTFEKLDRGTTYRSLFSKIQAVMNEKVPSQHPVLEGNGIDRNLFGGRFINQKPYVEIESIKGKEITIKAGLFAGLDTGAKVAVYNSSTVDPEKAVALDSGKIIKADMYESIVSLTKDFTKRQPATVWAFVTEPSYNIKPINISIVSNNVGSTSINFSESEISAIKENLKDLPLFVFDGESELLLVKGSQNDSIKIASNGYLFKTLKNSSTNTDQLKEEFQNYAQYKFLQGLEVKDANVSVEVTLVPVINGNPDTSKIGQKIVSGIYEYSEDDEMVLWVKNKGKKAVYFNVLDMQPDGKINTVLPNRSAKIYATDLKIEAGAARLFNKLTVAPPYGMEIFKVFASTDAIDLEGLATTRGAETRGNFTILEGLVKKSYTIASRGVIAENIGRANGSTYNILFRIKPREP